MAAAFTASGLKAGEKWVGPVSEEALSSTADFFRDEAARGRKSARLWGATGLVSVATVTGGWAGLLEVPAAVNYLTCVLAVGGSLGTFQELARSRHYLSLVEALSSDTTPADTKGFWVKEPTAELARMELASIQSSLERASESGLRAGCVIPVLLSGVAIYGLSAGTEQGEDLAGIAVGAALVMAVPSMLRYWSLKTRLARVEGLIGLLDRNLPTMEKSK